MKKKINDNIILIGTGHIIPDSIEEVKKEILKEKPDIIGVELDNLRYQFLKNDSNEKGGIPQSLSEIIQGTLRVFQKIIGNQIGGVQQGDDMKMAIKSAKYIDSEILLMDQNIQTTINKIKRKITKEEKIRLILSLLLIPFSLPFLTKKTKINQLTKNEEKVQKKMLKIKKEYPSIYKILIKERNNIMSKKIIKIIKNEKFDKIVAVMGAGHISGVYNNLQKWNKLK
ncbi:MAG: TraB domain-containing protein, partial [archaeon]